MNTFLPDVDFSLWQLQEMFESTTDVNSVSLSADMPDVFGDMSDEDYLRKGDKILSLLRQKRKTVAKSDFLFDFIKSGVFRKKMTYEKFEYLLAQISKKVMEPFFASFEEEDFHEKLEKEFSIGKIQYHFSEENEDEYAFRLMKAFFRKNPEKLQKVYRVSPAFYEEEDILLAVGENAFIRKSQNGRRYRLTHYSEGTAVSDVRHKKYAIIWLVKKLREEILKRLETGNPDDRIISFLHDQMDKSMQQHMEESSYGMLSLDTDMAKSTVVVDYLKKNQIPYQIIQERQYVSSNLPFFIIFLMAKEEELTQADAYFTAYAHWYNDFIVDFFIELFDVYEQDKKEESWTRKMASDYAASYQTKKNISGKMLRAMKTSSFNEWFGYVEFDNECDIEKIHEIEREFDVLARFLKLKEHQEVSLRFRKLGNHHALGLYYPALKCLCVDVRSPSSMAHECFHMLDYENGHVSKGAGFHKIVKLYEKLFMEKVEADSALKTQMNGKTKYNKEYYLNPTEIFARCGELYLTRVLKVDNSLVKPEYGFAYPEEESFMKEVELYFNAFFQSEDAE